MSEELENKEFDRSVREKFSEHKTSVPDYLWTSIENKAALLESASLRKRVVWYRWIVLGLVFLLGGVFFFYQLEDKFSNEDVFSELEIKEQHLAIENSGSNITEEAVSVSKVMEDKTSTLESLDETSTEYLDESENVSVEPFITNNIIEIKDSATNEDNSKSSQIDKIVIGYNNTAINSIEQSIQNDERLSNEMKSNEILNDEIVIEGEVVSGSQELESVKGNNNFKGSTDKEEDEEVNIIESVINSKENETNQNTISKKEDGVVENDGDVIEELIQSEVIEEVASEINESDSAVIDSIVASEVVSEIPVVNPVVKDKALSKITVTLFALPNFSSLGFEAESGTNEIYKTADETNFYLGFGANIGYSIADKTTVKLGVGYHQLKNEIELKDVRPKELPILINTVNKSITIYSSMGTVVANDIGEFEFAGDDEDDVDLDDEDDFASFNYKEEQKFVLLDIPLTIGYEIGKGKLKLLLEGGIVTSILITSGTKTEISNVNSPNVLVSVEDYHTTKKMILGGTVGVGLKYNISRRFTIVGLPTYNTSFMDMNKDNASKMKPNSINFSLGLQFRF